MRFRRKARKMSRRPVRGRARRRVSRRRRSAGPMRIGYRM